MKKIEISSSAYEKRFASGGWLIAANGYHEGVNDAGGTGTLGRHHATDEAFLLLWGEGYLITAGVQNAPSGLTFTRLKPGQLLVVEKDEWHTLVLQEGAQTLVVENADTCAENSEKHALTPEQRQEICKKTNVL